MRVLQAKTKRPLDLLAIGAGGHVAAACSVFPVRGDVEVWEIASGQHVFEHRYGDRWQKAAFTFVPGYIAIPVDDRIVFRDVTAWEVKSVFASEYHWPVATFASDGTLLLVVDKFSQPATDQSSIGCWEIKAGQAFHKLWSDTQHDSAFTYPVIRSDGKAVAVLLMSSRAINLAQIRGRTKGSVLATVVFPPAEPPEQLAFSADSTKLLARSASRTVKLFDAAGEPAGELVHPGRPYVTGMAVHPNGTVACSRTNGTVCLWNLEKRELIRTLDWKLGKLVSVAFSPDGTIGAAGTEDGQVIVWDVDL